MEHLVLATLQAHGWLSMIVFLVTLLKAVFHPIMTLIENDVSASGNQQAIAALNNIESSNLYKLLVWFISYLTSIDLNTLSAAVIMQTKPVIK